MFQSATQNGKTVLVFQAAWALCICQTILLASEIQTSLDSFDLSLAQIWLCPYVAMNGRHNKTLLNRRIEKRIFKCLLCSQSWKWCIKIKCLSPVCGAIELNRRVPVDSFDCLFAHKCWFCGLLVNCVAMNGKHNNV